MDLPHHHERPAPGRDFHRRPGGRKQLSKELILIEGAELGAQSHVEVTSGEGGLHRGRCGLWDGR
jgi:hypothetical protein